MVEINSCMVLFISREALLQRTIYQNTGQIQTCLIQRDGEVNLMTTQGKRACDICRHHWGENINLVLTLVCIQRVNLSKLLE